MRISISFNLSVVYGSLSNEAIFVFQYTFYKYSQHISYKCSYKSCSLVFMYLIQILYSRLLGHLNPYPELILSRHLTFQIPDNEYRDTNLRSRDRNGIYLPPKQKWKILHFFGSNWAQRIRLFLLTYEDAFHSLFGAWNGQKRGFYSFFVVGIGKFQILICFLCLFWG